MAANAPQAPTGARTRPAAPRRGDAAAAAAGAAVAFDDSPEFRSPMPGGSDSTAMPPEVPEDAYVEIDPTELEFGESVGTGATAEVFKGFWKGEPVAIKEIFLQRKKDAKAELKMQVAFMREVAVMSKVHHENLVKFLGVSLSMRPLRVVTEFCEGDTLFGLLHDEVDVELVWKQKLKMCTDVGEAMNYLHSFKPQIIHRDLKSLNLLLSKVVSGPTDIPLVKVSDFGLARMKDADAGSEWDKMTKEAGTCHWMAPEVPSGKYDEKADVFSYAMVLFEIICREIPFEEAEGREAVGLVMQGVRPDMEAVPPDRPEKLEQLMVACWSHKAGQRPNFQEICNILKSVKL
mmetsp:Transcript_17685/g.61967  ORF Transcript_17685/g.61967 Transcript_17685/m.61967 type:complete len:347 (-) Transcript_17685:283-1323(-)